jgi:hypothetical protein
VPDIEITFAQMGAPGWLTPIVDAKDCTVIPALAANCYPVQINISATI